jgi:hypothetical protein
MRRKRNLRTFDEVYGTVPFLPEELHDDFLLNTVARCFSGVWSCAISIRDRRLFVLRPCCQLAIQILQRTARRIALSPTLIDRGMDRMLKSDRHFASIASQQRQS